MSNPNAGRKKYEHMWEVTAGVVREWDPYGLLAGGAPSTELDGEITSLVAQIPRINTPTDAAHTVARIFGSAFEPDRFTPEICEQVGLKLYAALKESGLK